MNLGPFHVGGALTDEHSEIYIERPDDQAAIAHLRRMNYVMVIEPRQQGKTSLVNYLMRHPALDDMDFAYVDVSTPERSTESTWYQSLCPRILQQFGDFIPPGSWPTIPHNSIQWRNFLSELAQVATDANRNVVLALDEIGAVTFPAASEFFTVLRDVYNSRQAESQFRQLTFLLVGAFNPRALIQDPNISPFNIAQDLGLPDFDTAYELVSKAEFLDEPTARLLAERIHFWTDGHPYLTQLLCASLRPGQTLDDVDASVKRICSQDQNHLPRILEGLAKDARLQTYANRIRSGETIRFNPNQDSRHEKLALLGLVKSDNNGYCVIRNRIYQFMLENLTPGNGDETNDTTDDSTPETGGIDRLALSNTLNALPPQQLEQLIFTLKPPAGIIPPMPAPQGNRTAALLQWAESPTGRGLAEVQEVLNRILNPQ